jgi:hypothetical protein
MELLAFCLLVAGLFLSSPARAASFVYIVDKDSGSLSAIAKEIYGHAKHWKKIAGWNRLKPPYALRPGQELRLAEKPKKSSPRVRDLALPNAPKKVAAGAGVVSQAWPEAPVARELEERGGKWIYTVNERAPSVTMVALDLYGDALYKQGLIRENHLSPPYRLRLGQKLALPYPPKRAEAQGTEALIQQWEKAGNEMMVARLRGSLHSTGAGGIAPTAAPAGEEEGMASDEAPAVEKPIVEKEVSAEEVGGEDQVEWQTPVEKVAGEERAGEPGESDGNGEPRAEKARVDASGESEAPETPPVQEELSAQEPADASADSPSEVSPPTEEPTGETEPTDTLSEVNADHSPGDPLPPLSGDPAEAQTLPERDDPELPTSTVAPLPTAEKITAISLLGGIRFHRADVSDSVNGGGGTLVSDPIPGARLRILRQVSARQALLGQAAYERAAYTPNRNGAAPVHDSERDLFAFALGAQHRFSPRTRAELLARYEKHLYARGLNHGFGVRLIPVYNPQVSFSLAHHFWESGTASLLARGELRGLFPGEHEGVKLNTGVQGSLGLGWRKVSDGAAAWEAELSYSRKYQNAGYRNREQSLGVNFGVEWTVE